MQSNASGCVQNPNVSMHSRKSDNYMIKSIIEKYCDHMYEFHFMAMKFIEFTIPLHDQDLY